MNDIIQDKLKNQKKLCIKKSKEIIFLLEKAKVLLDTVEYECISSTQEKQLSIQKIEAAIYYISQAFNK